MTNTELADLLEEAARRLRGNALSGTSLQLYTEVEAAKLLRVGRPTIRKRFKPVKISNRGTRYRASDIEKFIEERARTPM